MKENDIVLTSILQADARFKIRPVLLLRELPLFGDFLVCGISTQIKHFVNGFDELITPIDRDFPESGLLSESIIRLGFLAVLPRPNIAGMIGSISTDRHKRLLQNLSKYLVTSATGK